MIHIDFDERYQDEPLIGHALSRRDGLTLSLLVHALLVAVLLFVPPMFQPSAEELEARRQELLERQAQERDAQRFVFVQPLLDLPAEQPRAEADLSDLDRQSQAPQAAVEPENPLPFSLGDSAERAEAAVVEPERALGPEGPEPTAVPEIAEAAPPGPAPEAETARLFPREEIGLLPQPDEAAETEIDRPPGLVQPRAGGSLGDALRNLQQYVQNETFDNPLGGVTDPGAAIQFDTKGIEFGPWLRRFVAQVRRNWFIPHAAMTFSGRVVLQFNIHKDGTITDLEIVQPSRVDAFTRAAHNAIRQSNPTYPLPPEYPEPMALFTVTFYYNEHPPGQLP